MVNIFEKIFPSGYYTSKKLGKKKLIGWISIGCLGSWFAVLPIVFNPSADIGSIIIATTITIFLSIIIGIFLTASGLIKPYMDDIVNWPKLIHYSIIFLTLALIALVTYTLYGKFRQQNE